MSLGNKQLDSIEQNDLQALIDDQVPEGRTIDYKESLPGNSDSDKKEFLADVSSFANATGGHLIFGISEESGIPIEVTGLHGINADAEVLRLENTIQNGIDPRIPGVATRAISLRSGTAIIIRIPRSFALPHVVDFKGRWRFYSRNSAGKYPLDVSEVRAAFALSETTAERLRNFRAERLSNIIAGETPVILSENSKVVLHVLPISAFDPATKVDVSSLTNELTLLQPIYGGFSHYRPNFDGFLTFNRPAQEDSALAYLQIFRNGSVESVDTLLLNPGERTIPSVAYEKALLEALPRYLKIQKQLGAEPPFFVMLSLVEVSGYTMIVDSIRFLGHRGHHVDRDTLLVPEVVVESFDVDAAEVMRPLFDTVWNAAGWPRSMNYDENGEWHER